MKHVFNERVKLFASFLNIAAAGAFVAGTVTNVVIRAAGAKPEDGELASFQTALGDFLVTLLFSKVMLFAIICAIILHVLAQVTLGDLKE